MKNLTELLDALESAISKQNVSNQAISKASVGWHIEHSLLTINGIITTLAKSNPDDYKWAFNFPRLLVYSTGKIPRGRAKAPDRVVPKVNFDADTLQTHLNKVRKTIKELDNLAPNHYFDHPFFGKLNVKSAIKTLKIHTQHHLAIIADILK